VLRGAVRPVQGKGKVFPDTGTCMDCTRETAASCSLMRVQCLAGGISDALHERPLPGKSLFALDGRTMCSAGARPYSVRGASATRAPQTSA